ncbi:DUF4079 domain-containing protein [Pleurocapsales cyanobacterium LEGE 06147]|nr:DUF4079 domain-containing protein [Pleurocapsales cyanobacterium LEGE 06147]
MMTSQLPLVLQILIAAVHPVMMLIAFLLTFFALHWGIQVRRTRNASGEEKKKLIKGKYNQQHFQLGSILLAVWIIGSLIGMVATYLLYSQIFLSPHLFGGLFVMMLGSIAAAAAPFMQQGKTWARTVHLCTIIPVLLLVFTQSVTGVELVIVMIKEFLGVG